MKGKRSVSLWIAVLIAAGLPALGGCRAVRGAADRGHRILDQPGFSASKLLGMMGASAGYAVGAPLTALLLPTYPLERLRYESSPRHDLEMPILFAPTEIGGGLGALLMGGPIAALSGALAEDP